MGDLYGEEDLFDGDEETGEGFVDFLREAVAEALDTEDGEGFLEWMRAQAPAVVPELFEGLPDEQARRGVASEIGRMLWNAIPLPGNGYRPRPIPRPERNDPCPCGSGRKYKRCCAEWAEAVPVLDPEVVWLLVIEELSLTEVEELGRSGKVPRALAGELATVLLDGGDAERALALVQPLFDEPERLDERDAAALDTLLEAYGELELLEERHEAVERLSRQLKPGLRAVLWESLVRSHAIEGEMEEAWEALEKARQDDPESPALGPLEVSLLLAEGRTAEAGERARLFRERFRRDPEAITEAGLEFLDKVAHDPEEAQLEFSFGGEVAAGLRRLRELLAGAEPPAAVYEVEEIEGEPGAGRLATPESLREVVDGWEEVFFESLPEPDFEDGFEEEDEEWDPWEEERAGRWLGYLLERPASLDSLEVLGSLADAVHELVTDRYASLDRPLLRPLLDRGLAILDRSLAARPEITRLPEAAEYNGPALMLILVAAAQAHRFGERDRAVELIRRLRSLNPAAPEEETGGPPSLP